jgi:transcriptional regulator GlxA family with amidase domain
MNYPTRLSIHALSVITMVKAYIDQHPLERKRIEYLTEMAGMNRKVLQRNFKQYYGITISEYQLQKRLESAAEMLEEGRLSKKQIACRCGYNNQNNFSKAFRKRYNISPRDWQRQILVDGVACSN